MGCIAHKVGGFIGTPKRFDMRGPYEPRYSSSNVIFYDAFRFRFRFRNVAIYYYGKIEIDAGIVNVTIDKNILRYNLSRRCSKRPYRLNK